MLHLKKTTERTAFSENCVILVKKGFCITRVSSSLKCAIHLFPRQNKVFTQHLANLAAFNFCFDLLTPFAF